jgi:hypothetical protein
MCIAGCTTGASDQGGASSRPNVVPPGGCDAERAARYVGRPADEVAEEARAAAGARTVRIVRPNQHVTMDFRPDRLNLETDAAAIVVKLRCG